MSAMFGKNYCYVLFSDYRIGEEIWGRSVWSMRAHSEQGASLSTTAALIELGITRISQGPSNVRYINPVNS